MTPNRIGSYPIEREVGRGGMGVVYLGRDTRLDRPVAIKVLPDVVARDPERLARFEREARLLAALTHPNIAGIYGLEEDEGGHRLLVLEYVEGETLRQRLERGPLPLDDVLDIGRQIAGAIEAAHEAGIIHRDLKPGNVKLTPGGQVKVLDFGLAKSAAGQVDSSPDLSQSPTMSHDVTGAGLILGTAAYMSPEQARGKPVDRRTDIWSFGCVLYECLTGVQAFAGETVSDTIALILQSTPDWSKLPPKTPEKLRALLARCLERDARGRLRDIGDARIELEEMLGSRVSSASRVVTRTETSVMDVVRRALPHPRTMLSAAVLLIAGFAVGALAWNGMRPSRPDSSPFRFTIQAPSRAELDPDPNEQAISPDGSRLAFVARDSTGQTSLWLRPLAAFESKQLPGTPGATLPFWSPDGRHIGFFSDGKLRCLHLADGSVEPICDAASGRGASWGRKGVIVFTPSPAGPLYQVPAGGGTPTAITALDSTAGETAHRWPSFLPDGEHFIYTVLPPKQGEIASYVGSLHSRARTPLLHSTSAPFFAAPQYVIYVRNDALVAQRFDPRGRRLHGDPFRIGERPSQTSYSGSPGAGVSATGVLAWKGAGKSTMRLVWLDRSGHEVGAIDIPPDRWSLFTISPDDKRACIEKEEPSGVHELWMVDLERGVANRLTRGQGTNQVGTFSPDGREILFGSNRRGYRDIYRRNADGSGEDKVFYQSNVPFKDVYTWSPDGRWVVMNEIGDETGWNLFVVAASGGSRTPYLVTSFNERNPAISPDGKWLFYVSDETGSEQGFVQSFPTPGSKQQVSKTGAIAAAWTRTGRELLLLRADLSVVSVPVTPGSVLRFGAPRELFRLQANSQGCWPTSDASRFLAAVPAERSETGISVAVNWRAGLED